MKVQVLYTENEEEIENAEKMNFPNIPVEKCAWWEYYIDMEYIHIACINNKGSINVFLPSGKWVLKYNEELWNKIKTHLNNK